MSEKRSKWIARALVLGGIAACAVIALASWPDEASLPGMALGSPVVLVAERTALLLAVWLFLVVVAIEAWKGRLPVEISGRGIKYANATTGQEAVDRTEVALRRHDTEIEALRREVVVLSIRTPRPEES